MNSETGKWIIISGVIIALAGVVIYFFHDKFNWVGRLPGDIRIENDSMKFYFPIVTCIVISIVGSVILYLVRKFF